LIVASTDPGMTFPRKPAFVHTGASVVRMSACSSGVLADLLLGSANTRRVTAHEVGEVAGPLDVPHPSGRTLDDPAALVERELGIDLVPMLRWERRHCLARPQHPS
jgi:hypothetical protein